MAQAETALADTRLNAPADGLIAARVREAGAMAAVGSPVYTLSLQDPVYVRAYVSQTQLSGLQPGSAVTVTADGSRERFKGTVGFISPKAEFTPKSVETTELRTELVYRVRIAVPGAARALRQGMPVTVELAAR
ncbi:HlyD family efflux transporter periplasmic adaptor subunit [Paucibacter sp. O1-1]|nr:HlyD family efflux transporter periplasmic adaptor subunit [Paucibacter sp. O1-1]MDA3828790.1 HlyD family efflux transporter periplasmic adaptor subunit [Paucibacter sp. O1-1]